MTRSSSRRAGIAGVAALALAALVAEVRAEDGEAIEGPGYPVGEGSVVHPMVGAEFGVLNNVFYEASSPSTSGVLRVLVEATLASKKIEEEPVDPLLADGESEAPDATAHQAMTYRAGARLAYDEFLSPEVAVRAQRNVGGEVHGTVAVRPKGAVSFEASERLVRDVRPTNFESVEGNDRIANLLALGLRYTPGGGTMSGRLRWENHVDFFERADTRFANRMVNTVQARYQWDFFPFSTLYADASLGFISGFAGEALNVGTKRSAMPIRGAVGIATVLSEALTVKAHAGWAYASYSSGAGYNVPVLGAELGYRYLPTGRVVGGYAWDHQDSINADFYRDHRLHAKVDHGLGRVVVTGTVDLRFRTYRGIQPAIGAPERSDLLLSVGARGQYVLKDWFAIVGEWRTELDQTSYMNVTDSGPDDPSYTRTEVTGGVRAAF
jgi:hypothetical protein